MSTVILLLFTLSAKQPVLPCNQGGVRCVPITQHYVPMRPPRLRDPVGPRK